VELFKDNLCQGAFFESGLGHGRSIRDGIVKESSWGNRVLLGGCSVRSTKDLMEAPIFGGQFCLVSLVKSDDRRQANWASDHHELSYPIGSAGIRRSHE